MKNESFNYLGRSGLLPLAPRGSRRRITLKDPASPSYCESGELCWLERSWWSKGTEYVVLTMVFLSEDLRLCSEPAMGMVNPLEAERDLGTWLLVDNLALIAAIVACTEPVVTGAATFKSDAVEFLWRAGSLPRRTCVRDKKVWKNCSTTRRAHRMQLHA